MVVVFLCQITHSTAHWDHSTDCVKIAYLSPESNERRCRRWSGTRDRRKKEERLENSQ